MYNLTETQFQFLHVLETKNSSLQMDFVCWSVIQIDTIYNY